MDDYKPVLDGRGGASRPLRWLLAVLLLFGSGMAADRWLLPHAQPATDPADAGGVLVPWTSGAVPPFAATIRGAGDAAACLETLLGAAANRPADDQRRRIADLLASDAMSLIERLVAGGAAGTSAGVRQTVVVRVWAQHAADATVLTVGARVTVQTYGLALLGVGGGAPGAASAAALTGGWAVHDLTVELTDAGWRLAALEPPVPAPAPDVWGTIRDGSPRDPQLLARVLGPDSWAPGTPS
ncbi:hypothetical protein [Dactylosporangium sp. NPDC049140]|uniref:hypothetical protein n=1 Tax=Dactylosporangium sp. NPDC049140 TaxID=3155647 RepID=UPI0033CCBABE